MSDARTPKAHTHDDRYYTEAEVNNLLATVTKSHIGVLQKTESITLSARGYRDYAFSFSLPSGSTIIAQIPMLNGNAFGISAGRDTSKNYVVRLWNNNSNNQDVVVQYYVVYVA